MAEIPCINCITFPICRSEAVSKDCVTFFKIRRKCSLVNDYLTANVDLDRVGKLYNFMCYGYKKVMENKLPCINCITLPICRNEYKAITERTYELVLRYFEARHMLERKCTLIFDYLRATNIKNKEIQNRRIELQKFMELKDKDDTIGRPL